MTKIIYVASAVFENKEGKILLTRRPDHKIYPGYYEFPGGKIEAGEKPEEALARELFEELHLNVACEDMRPLTFLSYTYPEHHAVLLVYHIKNWSGDLVLKENQGGYHWVSKDEQNLPLLLPANQYLIHYIKEIL